MTQVGKLLFFVDLGRVPGPVRRWLDQPIKQRIQSAYTQYNQRQSWNALIFVDTVTPSRLAGNLPTGN